MSICCLLIIIILFLWLWFVVILWINIINITLSLSSRDEDPGAAGALQSLCWGSRAVGAISSSYFAGSLVQTYGPVYVFGITAMLPLFTAAAGGYVRYESDCDSGCDE